MGVSAKSKVSYREFGQLPEEKLAQDEEFRNALYAECGIRRHYLFQPGQDFRQQEEATVALARQTDDDRKQHARSMDLDEPLEPDAILESMADDQPPPEETDNEDPLNGEDAVLRPVTICRQLLILFKCTLLCSTTTYCPGEKVEVITPVAVEAKDTAETALRTTEGNYGDFMVLIFAFFVSDHCGLLAGAGLL